MAEPITFRARLEERLRLIQREPLTGCGGALNGAQLAIARAGAHEALLLMAQEAEASANEFQRATLRGFVSLLWDRVEELR